jgi:hypothetical protein
VIDSGQSGVLQGTPLEKGDYTLAVRLNGDNPGRWALRFDHVPSTCVEGNFEPGNSARGTCTGDHVEASCASAPKRADASFLAVKCPATTANFTTCLGAGVPASPPVDLSATAGTLTVDANGLCSPVSDAAEVACKASSSSPACSAVSAISVTDARSGLLVVTANSVLNTAGTCNADLSALVYYSAP